MRGELLLDTGALVSLLDRSQTHHLKCRRAFADWTGPVVSTEAVLTEATHLLAGVQGGRAACVDFFLSGARFSFLRARRHCSVSGSCSTSMPICRWTLRMPRLLRWPRTSIARPCSRRIGRIFRSTESKAGSPFVSCRATESSGTITRVGRPRNSGSASVRRELGTRPVARHSRMVSWAIRTRRCERVSPGPLPSR